MAIQSKLQWEKYQYGIDIQKTRQLYGMSGKKLYMGQWIPRRTESVIIVEMNEAIAQHEAFFYRELNDHDHIIRTFGYVENSLNLTIFVQEYAEGSDLSNYFLDNATNLPQRILIEIFSQVASAMSYVARKSIVHGDLGCRNVLVYKIDSDEPSNTLVKITDFGLARRLDQPSITNENASIIPIRFCAPEILQNNNTLNYSEKSDVYSMGVLMWEALSNGQMPYSSIADDDTVKRIKLDNELLRPPQVCDRQLWMLMDKCWALNPHQRINFEQMQEQLSDVKIAELADIQISISTDQAPILCAFKLDVDVRMKESLNGSYGKTYDAQWISRTDRPIVLIKLDKPPTDHELLFYTKFKSHSYIIHTFGFVENNLQSTILLQERAPHGNLQQLLQNNQFQPSTKVLVELFLQIIDAMIYITEQNVVHGNLQCANVLVFEMHETNSKENLVKLTNFSSAHHNDPSKVKTRRSIIPVRHCALEILRSAGQSNYSELSEVYSMGVLMWEVCSNGQLPYSSSMLNSEVRQRKLNGEKLIQPWLCDNQIWSIMKDCWHNEPGLRYNFQEMKIRLSKMNFAETIYQYEMNVDVRMNQQLNGQFGKKFYPGKWISKNPSSIILLSMDEQIARQEVPFYLQLISHPHIIHTFGLVKNNLRTTILIQERASHGNLLVLLRDNQFKPSGSVLTKIFLQVIKAMIYIVDRMMIHGDLRCENVLVFQMNPVKPEGNVVKLTNFSLARRCDSLLMENKSTIIPVRYCAPEVLQNGDYSELSDVYSMGVLMWEACSKGEIPYGLDRSDDDIQQHRLNGGRLSKPNECDKQIWSVIEHCWYQTADLRFKFREIQSLLFKTYITCSHCRDQYLTDDMIIHQISCPPKPRPPPGIDPEVPLPPKDKLRDNPVKHLQSLPPSSTAVTSTLNNNTSESSVSSDSRATPKPSRSITDRIRSFFSFSKKKK